MQVCVVSLLHQITIKHTAMKTNYKVGDRFESKTGRIYEIMSFSKNPNIISYSVTIGKNKDLRNGSLSEVTKHTQI